MLVGRGGCWAAISPFFPRSPCRKGLSSKHNVKNWLQQVLFVAVPSVGSPHTRCPAWLPPRRAFSHSYPPGASLLLFVTSLGKMSHGHFACPQQGNSATLAAATPAPPRRCLAYQQAPSCKELVLLRSRWSMLLLVLPALTWASGRVSFPNSPLTKAWMEFSPRCRSKLPSPKR